MPRKKHETAFPASNTLLVLALLEDEDKYGYQIIRELECRSDQTFSMKEGTLYPIAARSARSNGNPTQAAAVGITS